MQRSSHYAAFVADCGRPPAEETNSSFAVASFAIVMAASVASTYAIDWPAVETSRYSEIFVSMTAANTTRVEERRDARPMYADVYEQPRRANALIVRPSDTKTMLAALDSSYFTLAGVRAGAPVPRIFIAGMPQDIGAIPSIEGKRSAFIRAVLPLILSVNEKIEEERRYLIELKQRHDAGQTISPTDQAWLALLAQRYKTKDGDWAALLERVDIVPPSLAIAQSIVESGWGSSAPARRMNALFGMIGGDGTTTAVLASYRSAHDSVAAYVHNLNTLFAYGAFRKQRELMREAGKAPDGHALAGTLLRYSELGAEYTRHIQMVINKENLAALDAARLVEQFPDG